VKGDFNCIIGPGDACKTTILTALDYTLSPRSSLVFDDSDFYKQDVDQDILIQVTLTDWDESQPEVKKFFSESKFGTCKCGLDDTGPISEPAPDGRIAISVVLRVDKSLEPKWFAVKGRDEGQGGTAMYASDRAILGANRLDMSSDANFTWGRNTILTRLSWNNQGNLNAVISELARTARQTDVSSYESITACQKIAEDVRLDAQKIGVKLSNLLPKIDIQKQSMNTGAVSLHEDDVPLRSKGSGSKKLVSCAMQMKLHGGKNISLMDEIEVGLEPNRIRGLIFKLKSSGQQVLATTHSPVVIRELNVSDNELYFCKKNADGSISLESLGAIPDIQGHVRMNAEAFLGSKIVACEGPTEIGCLRAYDRFRFDEKNPPVWSLATSYFNCGGGGKVKVITPKIASLGYKTAALCDNDVPDHLTSTDVTNLAAKDISVFQWEAGNSTENQLCDDLPWEHIPALLATICECKAPLEMATVVDLIIKDSGLSNQTFPENISEWPESLALRKAIGDCINKYNYIKRIDLAEKVLAFSLPLIPDAAAMKVTLNELWNWIQND